MMKILMHGAALAAVGLALSSAPAAAAGGETTTPTCPKGQVYNNAKQKCEPKTSAVDPQSLFETGRALAYAGRYDEAIETLRLAYDAKMPGVFNMLGYSYRKQGKLLVALGYYEEALRLDPNHVLTREYLGEAHLQMGDLASARDQLLEIEKRAGRSSAEFAELSKHIAAFEAQNG
ncbi:tetratricopeptide repeat protein [Aquibium sp. ELW1220]|uniref:tetratricopeptide repeat protein n=1 Tax=Aquibium sp. ELW1220 TaxID=2976766 RepID=UPI0025B03360|nr:tetratricopeptide repeat protein [Aquibium sp. ELW1220]MDN2579308.1 tetratricopeptide repeat protein [Aquibium sp. ELW1220]